MKEKLKMIFIHIISPIIIGFCIGHFIIYPYMIEPKAIKEANKEFNSLMDDKYPEYHRDITPRLDTIFNQGYEMGKISMAIGIITVLDSLGIKRPIPWDLKRASEIADSVKLATYDRSRKIVNISNNK